MEMQGDWQTASIFPHFSRVRWTRRQRHLLGNSRRQPTNTVIGLDDPRSRLHQGGTMRCWRALPIGLALLSILYAGCGRDAGGTAEAMETTGDPLLPVCRVEEVSFLRGGNR